MFTNYKVNRFNLGSKFGILFGKLNFDKAQLPLEKETDQPTTRIQTMLNVHLSMDRLVSKVDVP